MRRYELLKHPAFAAQTAQISNIIPNASKYTTKTKQTKIKAKMKELTKEKLAEMLNGHDVLNRDMHGVPTNMEVWNSNLVVLYGYSDDRIVVRGAVHDEIDSYGDDKMALVLAGEKIDDDEDEMNIDIPGIFQLSDDYDQSNNPRLITVRYGSVDNTQADWEFDTVMPHSTFMLNRKGKPFCKGIVIDLDEIK